MLILILIFLIYYIWVFKNQLISVSSIHFKCHVSHTKKQTNKQTNKQRRIIATYKNEFHGTCIASKKQYKTQYVSTSKNSPKQLFPHIWLFSMSRKPFLTCTAFPSSQTTNNPRTDVRLRITQRNLTQSKNSNKK